MERIGLLRAIREDELETIRNWRNHPNVRKYMYTTHEISKEEHKRWWDKVLISSTQEYYIYQHGNDILGVVAFVNIDSKNSNSSWAFYAAPNAPRGTGSRMEYLALEHAFNKLNLHKLCCEVLDFNKSVIKLHEKFGFKVEGIFRQQHRVDDGFNDVYRLGILNTEWVERKPNILRVLNR